MRQVAMAQKHVFSLDNGSQLKWKIFALKWAVELTVQEISSLGWKLGGCS